MAGSAGMLGSDRLALPRIYVPEVSVPGKGASGCGKTGFSVEYTTGTSVVTPRLRR